MNNLKLRRLAEKVTKINKLNNKFRKCQSIHYFQMFERIYKQTKKEFF